MVAELLSHFHKEGLASSELLREKVHPLDELGDKTWLTSGERVTIQNSTVSRIYKQVQAREYKPSDEALPHDVVGAEIFVRKLDSDPSKYVAGAFCITETSTPAIEFTPSIMYFHPSDVEKWGKLSQGERRESFKSGVLPFIERMIVVVPGWGNELLGQERKALELLAGMPVEIINKGSEAEYMSSETEKRTAILSMATMGAHNSLDISKKDQLTDLGILQQVYETIDRVGQQVMQAKVEYVLKDPERTKAKLSTITQVMRSVHGGDFRKNAKAQAALARWYEYHREEDELMNGTWWRERQAVLDGHSMGGNKALDLNAANYLKEVPGLLEYRRKIDKDTAEMTTKWRESILVHQNEIRESLLENSELDSIPAPERVAFYDFIAQQFSALPKEISKTDQERDAKSSIGIFPHLGVVAEMAVILGPGVGKEEVEEKYGWILEDDEGFKITPERALAQVALLTDAISFLVKVPIQLTRWNKDRVRTEIMSVFGRVGLVGAIVASKIGRNALGFEDMLASTWDSKMHQPHFIEASSRVLSSMTPLASENTLAHATQEQINRLVEKTRIIAGEQDKTVDPLLTKLFGANLVGKVSTYIKTIVRSLPKSGHCVSEEEFPQVRNEIYRFLNQHSGERREDVRYVLKMLYASLTGEKYDNVTLIS